MTKTFNLIVVTPEREFYNGIADSLTVESTNGQITVLAGHIPMVTALGVGTITIRTDGKTMKAAHSEGFMEVRNDGVVVLSQACEWPEEIDVERANEARRRAEQRMKQKEDIKSYSRNRIAMLRAINRLKLKEKRK